MADMVVVAMAGASTHSTNPPSLAHGPIKTDGGHTLNYGDATQALGANQESTIKYASNTFSLGTKNDTATKDISISTGTASTGNSGNIVLAIGEADSGTKGVVSVSGSRLQLDAHGNNVGLRIPTKAGIPANVTGSANGDIVIDTTNHHLYFKSTTWLKLNPAAASTLDEAYDGPSGSGSGRTITADSGAVQIVGSGSTSVLDIDSSTTAVAIDVLHSGNSYPLRVTATNTGLSYGVVSIQYGSGTYTAAPNGVEIDFSAMTAINSSSDVCAVKATGRTNAGSGDSYGMFIDDGFDYGIGSLAPIVMASASSNPVFLASSSGDCGHVGRFTSSHLTANVDNLVVNWASGTYSAGFHNGIVVDYSTMTALTTGVACSAIQLIGKTSTDVLIGLDVDSNFDYGAMFAADVALEDDVFLYLGNSPTDDGLLVFTGDALYVATQSRSSAATPDVIVGSGAGTGYASGSLTLSTGTASTANTGAVSLYSGDATTGASGDASFYSGDATSDVSGAVSIYSGGATSANSGSVVISSGTTTTSGDSGNISLTTGIAAGTRGALLGTAGVITLEAVGAAFTIKGDDTSLIQVDGSNKQLQLVTTGTTGTLLLQTTGSAAELQAHTQTADANITLLADLAAVYIKSETPAIWQTNDQTSANSSSVTIRSGNITSSGNSAAVTIGSGTAPGTTGAMLYQSGASTGNATGQVDIQSGQASGATGATGDVYVQTGTQSHGSQTTYKSGTLYLKSGNCDAYQSGGITVLTGAAPNLTGALSMATGNSTGTSLGSGAASLVTGTASAASGNISIATGDRSVDANYGTGTVTIESGDNQGDWDSGDVTLRSGNSDDYTGFVRIYSGDSDDTRSAGSANTGDVLIYTGAVANAHTGDAKLYTGACSSGGASSSTGAVYIYTGGSSTGPTGDVNIDTGSTGTGAFSGWISLETGGGSVSSGNIYLTTGSTAGTRGDLDCNVGEVFFETASQRITLGSDASSLRIGYGTSNPTSGYDPSSLFIRTDQKKLYINTGTIGTPTWTVVGTQT